MNYNLIKKKPEAESEGAESVPGEEAFAAWPLPRATEKRSGVRGQAGLSQGKTAVPEGPPGHAAQQTAAGSVRNGSRSSTWEEFRAEFLTFELSLHPAASHFNACQLLLGNMARVSPSSPPL